MRRPYLAHLGEERGIRCMLVDGAFIRNHLDVDFTNGAHDLTRRYIPRGEIWVDRDAPGAGEVPILVTCYREQRAHMAAGAPYLLALLRANRTERRLRRAALRDPHLPLSAARARVRRQHVGALDGDAVFVVDGRGVRDRFDPNFTQGGHHWRYRFIPRREIWIDDAVAERELDATLAHEAHELALMRKGARYEAAHESALALEREVRALRSRSSSRRIRMNRPYGKLQTSALLSKLCNIRFISY
jgi:hypothetical protein